MKIHYRNRHGTTNIPWQAAFRKHGELSLGDVSSFGFPKEIDHLHLGGSCKGAYRASGVANPILPDKVKQIQADTGCAISVFFGDAWLEKFQFHHDLLDADIPRLKIYSTALYGTRMWRSEVTWVMIPLDESMLQSIEHKENDTVLFVGQLNPYRKKIIEKLNAAGIKVDVVGKGGNLLARYGTELSKLSRGYSISIGMLFDEERPRTRYCSIRLPSALAMGLIYIEAGFDLRGVFEQDELIQWHSIDDLIDKIRYYQKNPSIGYEISMRGRDKVVKNWTFNKLASQFLKEGDDKTDCPSALSRG